MDIEDFIRRHMHKHERLVAARLQAALALLEKVRETPSLVLVDHLASKGSSGLQSHETYGTRAHERLHIKPINKNHGRRSSSLQDWGQDLLDLLKTQGFEESHAKAREELIDGIQKHLGGILQGMGEQFPLTVRISGRSAEHVIGDLLKQADEKNKAGDVAQYLVGAKLKLRFDEEIPVRGANKGDRKSIGDSQARAGDFEIRDGVIEIAVGLPDDKHISQIADALDQSDAEVWLLTRADRVLTWKNELEKSDEIDDKRVVVTSVEAFIGQNVTELGKFSASERTAQLKALFKIYNEVWVRKVGNPAIMVIVK